MYNYDRTEIFQTQSCCRRSAAFVEGFADSSGRYTSNRAQPRADDNNSIIRLADSIRNTDTSTVECRKSDDDDIYSYELIAGDEDFARQNCSVILLFRA